MREMPESVRRCIEKLKADRLKELELPKELTVEEQAKGRALIAKGLAALDKLDLKRKEQMTEGK